MSEESRQITVELASPQESTPPFGLPENLWYLVIHQLESGQDYLVLLDEDWRILQANGSFRREIAGASDDLGAPFVDLLTEGSARELRRLIALGHDGTVRVELMHRVRGGIRSVSYTFRLHDGKWLAFGRDQSIQLELVSQMATLISDLEVRVDSEKERAAALKRLSEKDPLTGLANRRAFERSLASHTKLLREHGSVFSVISIDIDHFKRVNDEHGHPAGDEVLRRVARILEDSLRDGDCVGRLGGEEFVVIARGAGTRNALDLGERLRSSIETSEMPTPVGKVTISVGVSTAQVPAGDGDVDNTDLLQKADDALYAAKRSGRNCVRASE